MRFIFRLLGILFLTLLLLAMAPLPAHAESDRLGSTTDKENPINECLAAANGGREAFIDCIHQNQSNLQEKYGLNEAWVDSFLTTVERIPDWVGFVRRSIDRIEDRLDRYEDQWDRREDRWDRHEDRYDRWEDRWDRWEDTHDDQFDREDLYDRKEDRQDRREDHRDRRENRWDRAENRWDRWEDRRDR